MPVPALAVKARPGSGRGCTNGGLASSAHGRRKTAVPVGRDRAFSIFILFSGLPRHPFYTGKQKLVDTSGRVDKFNKKYGIK